MALAGVIGPPLFVVGFVVAGLLRPGYSGLRQEVSALGVGPMSWLQNGNFILFGALLVLFAVGFAAGTRGWVGRGSWWAMVVLLGLSGVGVILSGVFTAAPGTEVLHWLGGFVLAFLPPIIVLFIAAATLRHSAAWRPVARYSLVLGIVAVALIAATFVFLNPAFPTLNQFGGLLQRLLVVDVFAWHVVVGWRLWSAA